MIRDQLEIGNPLERIGTLTYCSFPPNFCYHQMNGAKLSNQVLPQVCHGEHLKSPQITEEYHKQLLMHYSQLKKGLQNRHKSNNKN